MRGLPHSRSTWQYGEEETARRKEVNRGKKKIRGVNGAPELGRSERGPKR